MPNYRWKQILEMYPNQQEVIDLYNSKQIKELKELWNCSVDCVRTVSDKLGLQKKNISQIELIQRYTKEQLEDLYFNKYDRHLKDMSAGLNVYQDTLSQVFETLNIVQQPHHVSEYVEVRQILSEKAKERAKIENPINHILDHPDWIDNMVKARQDNDSYQKPHHKNEHALAIPLEQLKQEVQFLGIQEMAKKYECSPSTLYQICKDNNIELSTGAPLAIRQTEKYKQQAYRRGVLGVLKVKRADTDIEKLLKHELRFRKIKFRSRKRLIKRTIPDVIIQPNIAVFTDGCFWHGCPEHCPTSKIGLGRSVVDLEINIELAKKGYKVFRIWGHDVKDPIKLKEFVNTVEAYINEQKNRR